MTATDPDTLPDYIPAPMRETVTVHALGRGSYLFRRGEPVRWLAYVLEGEVKAVRYQPDGAESVMVRGLPGEFFAEASLATGHYVCDGIAKCPSRVALWSADEVKRMLGESGEFGDGSRGMGLKSNSSRLGVKGSMPTTLADTALFYKAEIRYGAADEPDAEVEWREGYAGLKGAWGKVRLGRLSTHYKTTLTKIDPWNDNVPQSRHKGKQGSSSIHRSYFNNAVEYVTPKRGGVSAALWYSTQFDGETDQIHNAGEIKNFEGGDAGGVGVRYVDGPWFASAGYLDIEADKVASAGMDNGTGWEAAVRYKGGPWSVAAGLTVEWTDVYDDVVSRRDPQVVLLDARPRAMCTGEVIRHSIRGGHIPGAINIVGMRGGAGTDAAAAPFGPARQRLLCRHVAGAGGDRRLGGRDMEPAQERRGLSGMVAYQRHPRRRRQRPDPLLRRGLLRYHPPQGDAPAPQAPGVPRRPHRVAQPPALPRPPGAGRRPGPA